MEKDKVLYGKDGWLFLTNDTNRVLDQISGAIPYTSDIRSAWLDALSARKEHSRKYGYLYRFIIVPNKHCIYREFLPEAIKVSDDRLVMKLSSDFPELIIYPYQFLLDNKAKLLYHKTDTHWNSLATVLFMNSIANQLGSHEVDFQIRQRTIVGDLGSKLDPKVSSITNEAVIDGIHPVCVFDNNVPFDGHYHVFETKNKELPVGAVFCDSFFNTTINIISSYFSKLYVFSAPVFDKPIIEKIRPDVVLSENVERFVRYPCTDRFSERIYRKYFLAPSDTLSLLPYVNSDPDDLCELETDKLNSFKDLTANKTLFPEKSFNFLVENFPSFVFQPHNRPATGTYWRPSDKSPFKAFAAGFTTKDSINPRGIAFNIDSAHENREFFLQFYELASNDRVLDLSCMNILASYRYETRELGLYDSSQEINFPTPDLFFPAGRAFCWVLSCDRHFGMGRSLNDIPDYKYIFRGWYSLDESFFLHPINGNSSVAWRFTYGVDLISNLPPVSR